jgi:hypothetical protein
MLCKVHGHPELHLPQDQDVGAQRVITIHTTYQHTYECDIECCEYAKAIIGFEVLAVDLEAWAKEALNPKRSTSSFKPIEGVKEVPLDPSDFDSKTVRINTTLDTK